MPLYSYECDEHGVMEMVVPLSESDGDISCPMCGYNDYLDESRTDESKKTPDSVVDFSTWLEHGWQKLAEEGSSARILRRVPSTPLFRVR